MPRAAVLANLLFHTSSFALLLLDAPYTFLLTVIMKFSVVAALLTFAVSGYAQSSATTSTSSNPGGIAITAPGQGVVWEAGKAQTVTWTVSDSSISTINSIYLRKGVSAYLDTIGPVTTTAIDASKGQWTWNIPNDTATDSSYALEVRTSGGSSYSPYFTIMGAAPGTNSTSYTTDAAPSGSASATGSGASGSASSHDSGANAIATGFIGTAAVAVAGAAILF
ncbi:hypothetical protein BCR43DRAFT_31121 [Syncephalastrum racemosum]|uniref:Yeast cell wall synthesis Kre9/Knh1-like N-terminal domain-containing protein n=1 Tax=Syncephalastrum racemosum TaxID=13706 RepID=A0A1X2HTS2_SYNRA|nr:hypothetical protein BCR43DRAFT_31121 [Syncephalastrum racemosum]